MTKDPKDRAREPESHWRTHYDDGPPGLAATGMAVALFVVTVWLTSERRYITWKSGGWVPYLVVGLLWCLVLYVSLYRLLTPGVSGKFSRPRGRAAVRWAMVPALCAMAVFLSVGGYTFGARFALSRPALDEAATKALAGHAPIPGWIGLFPIEEIVVEGGSVRFAMIDQLGFVRDAELGPDSAHLTPEFYERIDDRWLMESFSRY